MSRTQCYEWFKRFEKGRMSVGEEPRPGRPSTSTDDDLVVYLYPLMGHMACTEPQCLYKGEVDPFFYYILALVVPHDESIFSTPNYIPICRLSGYDKFFPTLYLARHDIWKTLIEY